MVPDATQTEPETSDGMKAVLKLVRIVAVPLIVVIAFVILVSTAGGKGSLEVNAREGKLAWKPAEGSISPQKAHGLDPSTYFIDSLHGFAVKKLGQVFSPAKLLTPSEFLSAKGLTVTSGEIRNNPLLRNMQLVRFSAGHDLRLTVTPQTKIDVYGKMVALGESLKLSFANELLVYILPKDALEGFHPNVVQFYGLISQVLQTQIKELTASQSSILAFAHGDFEGLRVGSRNGTLHVDRALLVTESPSAFYGAEIQFSGELDQSADLWRELRDAIQSFRVISR
jgi:hypothetical protein